MEIVIQKATSSKECFLQNIYSKLSSINFALTFHKCSYHCASTEIHFPISKSFQINVVISMITSPNGLLTTNFYPLPEEAAGCCLLLETWSLLCSSFVVLLQKLGIFVSPRLITSLPTWQTGDFFLLI